MSEPSIVKSELTIESEEETQQLGRRLGEAIVAAVADSRTPAGSVTGVVIALNGTLGAGKTRLTQAVGIGLGIDGQITSPTYTICVPHQGQVSLLHLDAYRIKDPTEVDELDLDYRVQNGEVLIVEWADRIRDWMPDIDLEIGIESTSDTTRKLRLTGYTAAGTTLALAMKGEV